MNRALQISVFLFTIALLSVGMSVWAARDRAAVRSSNADSPAVALRSKTIAQLIAQLGDEQYLNRRSAELRLIEFGSIAFDLLQMAENHSDLEIASRARYILRRIHIDWVRPNDSAEVQTILQNYGTISSHERLQRIAELEILPAHEGWGALCRIARYDKSSLIARTAALEILGSELDRPEQLELTAFRVEIEGSRRVPVRWIRLYFDQLKQPEKLSEGWLPQLDSELELLEEEGADTSKKIIVTFIQFHLDLSARYSQPEQAFESFQRWVDLLINHGGRENESLVPAMLWVLKNQQWGTLELAENHYSEKIRNSRLLLYLAGMARSKQDKKVESEEYAEQAFQQEKDAPAERFLVTLALEELGRHDWAEREWKFLVKTLPVFDVTSAQARNQLASLRLHDRGEDRAAAELLAEYCETVEVDPAQMKNILTDPTIEHYYKYFGMQRDFFLAYHAEQQGDFAKQRQLLEAVLKKDKRNADVLIAMYHMQEADEAYRAQTLKRIRGVSKQLDSDLKRYPDEVQFYNHWAWLIGNTEGDYAKAVEYSLRSLELSPDSPSLLDTLGRCYYAAGDLENAVKYQRQAVEGHPHMTVMQRQLDLFERELAKSN